jgi:serine/threonine protein kinase
MASSLSVRENSSSVPLPASPLRTGAIVGQYQLLRCIGQGGSGVVYQGVHQTLGRAAAIKVLHARMTQGDAAHEARTEQRFLREARAAAQVRHPHIVDVYDCGVANDVAFLVMELVEGESLAQLLRRLTRLERGTALEILLPILSATAELHAAGVVHRDIKPANILLARGPNPCPKLADFGVSRFEDGSLGITDSGATLGTLEYMAPELIQGKAKADERSDQYALGVTLYECIVGQQPFRGVGAYGLMQAIVAGSIVSGSTRASALSGRLGDVVSRAMHPDSAHRFSCIDELAEALLPFATPQASAHWRSQAALPVARLDGSGEAHLQRRPETKSARVTGSRGRRSIAFVAGALVGGTLLVALVVTNLRSSHGSAKHPAASAPTETAPARSALSTEAAPPAAITVTESESVPPTASATSTTARHVKAFPGAVGATDPKPPRTDRGENGAPILDVP